MALTLCCHEKPHGKEHGDRPRDHSLELWWHPGRWEEDVDEGYEVRVLGRSPECSTRQRGSSFFSDYPRHAPYENNRSDFLGLCLSDDPCHFGYRRHKYAGSCRRTFGCWLEKNHDDACRTICSARHCGLERGHEGRHRSFQRCGIGGCNRQKWHLVPHFDLRSETLRSEAIMRAKFEKAFKRLTSMVLRHMGISTLAHTLIPSQKTSQSITQSMRNASQKRGSSPPQKSNSPKAKPYSRIDLKSQEIRLFKLWPSATGINLRGSFDSCQISQCPSYIALSYAWGDQVIKRNVKIDNGTEISVGNNLWQFLRLQSTVLTEAAYFWIDAICINQDDIHERNHQVGMMKAIYYQATEVYVWLGMEADDSDHAMEFVTQQSTTPLRKRGCGYYTMWDRRTAKALSSLSERPYWRRMWIIQEILHATRITVWCGTRKFDWIDLETLYRKLETIYNRKWFAHHELLMAISGSAAATMIWQRAHWRHPKTPPPRLSRLIDIFRDWHCTDIRDKVFALVGMASPESAIVPDYALNPRQIYCAVMGKVKKDRDEFANLLSQLLGVSGKDIDLWNQTLIEYKVQPSERMVLTSRYYDDWE